ncbi:O-glucosyltransferase rumi homolog [Venturia canescens]|uniref:O-glucosyltransferase rumi homolog n=1 Tax=Venturia canescens TaxID=32260 RepID=UPI001C9C9B77|nr:O-glucosyltransferase rumi homolog [Venturia canescens]
MHFLILIIFSNIFPNIECSNEFCSIDGRDSCEDGRQNEKDVEDLDIKYRELSDEIWKAEDRYEPCEASKCGCFTGTITQDLEPFASGINLEMIENARSRGTLYQLIGGRLYRDEECMFPSRCAGIEYFILKVAKKINRDIEFVVNTRDYPQSARYFGTAQPIFSFSKTPEYFDIRYPAWSFWEGGPAISLYPRGLGRWDEHRKSINKSSTLHPWETKLKRGFFRGSRTSTERDNLILLSRKKAHLLDAAYTKNQAWRSKRDTLDAEPAEEVSLESHCRYKYLFNYRGVAASFRHKHLFLCRSLVFHVGDEWTEFYYEVMKPWIHYIPVHKDASQQQLEHLLNFARDNDNLVKKIADRGRDFIWNKLRMQDVTCFWRRLLQRYSKLLTYEPRLRNNLKEIS